MYSYITAPLCVKITYGGLPCCILVTVYTWPWRPLWIRLLPEMLRGGPYHEWVSPDLWKGLFRIQCSRMPSSPWMLSSHPHHYRYALYHVALFLPPHVSSKTSWLLPTCAGISKSHIWLDYCGTPATSLSCYIYLLPLTGKSCHSYVLQLVPFNTCTFYNSHIHRATGMSLHSTRMPCHIMFFFRYILAQVHPSIGMCCHRLSYSIYYEIRVCFDTNTVHWFIKSSIL